MIDEFQVEELEEALSAVGELLAAEGVDPGSVHDQDLIALRPTEDELESAAEWVRTQDAAAEWATLVEEVIRYVERDR